MGAAGGYKYTHPCDPCERSLTGLLGPFSSLQPIRSPEGPPVGLCFGVEGKLTAIHVPRYTHRRLQF